MPEDDKEYSHVVMNSQENWDILEKTGIHWWEGDSYTVSHLKVETDTYDNLRQLIQAVIDNSSDPFPDGMPDYVKEENEYE